MLSNSISTGRFSQLEEQKQELGRHFCLNLSSLAFGYEAQKSELLLFCAHEQQTVCFTKMFGHISKLLNTPAGEGKKFQGYRCSFLHVYNNLHPGSRDKFKQKCLSWAVKCFMQRLSIRSELVQLTVMTLQSEHTWSIWGRQSQECTESTMRSSQCLTDSGTTNKHG